MSRKLTICYVIIAFIIAFSFMAASLFTYHYKFQDGDWVLRGGDVIAAEKNFYSQHFNSSEKKIFLVGSSQIWALNSTHIEKILAKEGTYRVYNLAKAYDRPSSRINTINMMISAKPDIVVYGIADRDFSSIDQTKKTTSILPNISILFRNFFSEVNFYNFDFIQSPKLDMLKFLKDPFTIEPTPQPWLKFPPNPPNTFFYDSPAKFLNITDDNTLKKSAERISEIPIESPEDNEDAIAFNKIVNKLKQNGIHVIIFTTPQQKYRLEQIKNFDRFDEILKNISMQTGIISYSLWDKYADLQIWGNIEHVAVNKKALIYSEDIARIILKEIEK